MARKRMIDPTIWADEDFGSLSRDAQIVFIGMVSNADDEGRMPGNALYLLSTILPYESFTEEKAKAIRDEILNKMKSLKLYVVNGKEFLCFLKWKFYQKVDRASESKYPPFVEDSSRTRRGLDANRIEQNRIEQNKKNEFAKANSQKENAKPLNPRTASSDSLPNGENPNIAGIERMRENLKGKLILNAFALILAVFIPISVEAKTFTLNSSFTTDSKYKLATATASLRLRDKTPEKSRRVPAPDVAAVSVRQLICRKFRNNCEMAVAIARAESGLNCGRRSYMANANGTYDHGLFQINDVHKSRLTKLGMTMQDMYDCEKNIEYAHDWLYAYQGWSPWSAYKNKSYMAFLK